MPASSDHPAGLNTHHTPSSPYYQNQAQTNGYTASLAQARGRGRYERGRETTRGATNTRIYPRELTKSPPSLLPSRYQAPTSPTIPPSKPNNQSGSPLLSALSSTTTYPVSSAAYHTNEWTKSLPVFSGDGASPSGGVSLSGSPPAHPASYGDRVGGVLNNALATSPGQIGRNRPLSHPTGYPGFEEHLRQGSGTIYRRSSMYSQYSQKPLYATQPPLPHLPQAHFYGAPNADLGLPKSGETGLVPGEGGYFCGFDSLATAGDPVSTGAENVLLMGWQGGLDIFRVERDKLDMIGRLEDLRGSVIEAKILPWVAREDPFAPLRPLVALVINGPMPSSTGETDQKSDTGQSDHLGYASSDHPETVAPPSDGDETISEATHYQTTVEVYSLSKRVHVRTLYSSPPVPILNPVTSPLFTPPPQVGCWKIDANGKFVVVSSGTSGEIFIFRVGLVEPTDGQTTERGEFVCMGKVWTSVELNSRRKSPSSTETGSQCGDHHTEISHIGTPLLSLSHRWLAYVPPAASSSTSLNGKPFSKSNAPGLSSHRPPAQPAITCAVDTPEGESLFNRMAREVTQEVIKGAKWVGDQGIQAWRYYWNRPAPATGPDAISSGIGQIRDSPVHPPLQHHFPPTHAHANHASQSNNYPTLTSVLDLEKLAGVRNNSVATALSPIATFQTPLGCSFLSFAPSGLALLTASRKGDVQFVWDLVRMTQGKISTGLSLSGSAAGAGSESRQLPYRPHVRQVARFTRLTIANIVDVAWTAPQGERLAIVTEKGTVHILGLPASAFQWPPPRRSPSSTATSHGTSIGVTQDDAAIEAPGRSAGGAGSAVTAAVQMVNSKTQPLISAARRRGSSGAGLTGIGGMKIAAAGASQGGMSMAAGLSKSLGAATGTVSSLRNTGENRLHLPGNSGMVSPGCVRWLGGKERGLISLVCGGVLRVHEAAPCRGRKSSEKRRRTPLLKPVEFSLPYLPSGSFPPAVVDDAPFGPGLERILGGHWSQRLPAVANEGSPEIKPHPLSYAEIETNPPYQPFHTDRRINLYVYDSPLDEWDTPANIHHVNDPSPWAFGKCIPATKLDVGPPAIPGDDGSASATPDGLVGPIETVLRLGKDDEEVDQVVVTTRRRKKASNSTSTGDLNDGFFEDDCEVLDFAADRV